MQGVPEQFEFVTDKAEFRITDHRAGVELYRAHIVKHAFEPHTHEAYGFGAIEFGAERFRYNGTEHIATSNSIILMNPEVLHTGKAETEQGWCYRMIYIEPTALELITGERGWWFSDAVVNADKKVANYLTRLLSALWQAEDKLEFDGLLFQLASMARQYTTTRKSVARKFAHRFAPVLDYMQASLDEHIVLEQLADIAGLSPFHFLRQFQMQYQVTPHQMLMAKRLHRAKQLLGIGMAPAAVAASTGLADQSHLCRAFVRRYGVTPARYQRQVRQH